MVSELVWNDDWAVCRASRTFAKERIRQKCFLCALVLSKREVLVKKLAAWKCLEKIRFLYPLLRWTAPPVDVGFGFSAAFVEARRGVGRGKSSPTPKRWNAFGVHRWRGVELKFYLASHLRHPHPPQKRRFFNQRVHFMRFFCWDLMKLNSSETASCRSLQFSMLLRRHQLQVVICFKWVKQLKFRICVGAIFVAAARWKCITWPRWMQRSLPLKLRQSWKTSLSAWKPMTGRWSR